ncbi:MAG: AbrB/MazE/SpoVT family DNA-binding domain-containing protein [Clostridiales Family XIII bacterium]|jgi:antitoxin MazE|nr:AbrB/MazE/SpoVT family DNA-binding domain-containing protein [Clostridiales Family XIII bacterium]
MSTNVRLAAWGNSIALRIPKPILNQSEINENAIVTLEVTENKEIIIKQKYRHRTLEERFAGWDGNHEPELVDFGTPVGGEVW